MAKKRASGSGNPAKRNGASGNQAKRAAVGQRTVGVAAKLVPPSTPVTPSRLLRNLQALLNSANSPEDAAAIFENAARSQRATPTVEALQDIANAFVRFPLTSTDTLIALEALTLTHVPDAMRTTADLLDLRYETADAPFLQGSFRKRLHFPYSDPDEAVSLVAAIVLLAKSEVRISALWRYSLLVLKRLESNNMGEIYEAFESNKHTPVSVRDEATVEHLWLKNADNG